MSVASKRRFITNKVETEMYVPTEEDVIGQVRQSRGNNLHEVIDENGDVYVASMPSKFRKAVWIRRGQFVVLRSIGEGDKVKAEIEHILDEENVLYMVELKKWPEYFADEAKKMTRESRRGIADGTEEKMIDDDMMPPSDSEEDYSDEENEEVDDEEDEDEDSEAEVYNPNRNQAPAK